MAVRKSAIIVTLVVGALLVVVVLFAMAVMPPFGQVAPQTEEQEIIDQLWREGEDQDLFGILEYSGGTASGKYIEFEYSESDGAMSDIRMNTGDGMTTVLDGLAVTGLDSTVPTVTGPLFRVDGPLATLIVHNNPTDLIQIGAETGGEIILSFPQGAEVTRNTDIEVPSYNISVDGAELWLGVSNADIRAVGNELRITFTGSGAAMIRQLPQIESVGEDVERAIMRAIDTGFIGGELWTLARSEGYVQESASLNGVDISVTSAEVGMVTMEASAQFQGGSIILVNVDRETIDPDAEGGVTVGGEDAQNVDLVDLLESAESGDASPAFSLFEGENATKFLIYVPDLTAGNEVVIANT